MFQQGGGFSRGLFFGWFFHCFFFFSVYTFKAVQVYSRNFKKQNEQITVLCWLLVVNISVGAFSSCFEKYMFSLVNCGLLGNRSRFDCAQYELMCTTEDLKLGFKFLSPIWVSCRLMGEMHMLSSSHQPPFGGVLGLDSFGSLKNLHVLCNKQC